MSGFNLWAGTFWPEPVLRTRAFFHLRTGRSDRPERAKGQPHSQAIPSPERKTLVGSGHVAPRVWVVTNKIIGADVPKIDSCFYLAWCREEKIMFSSKQTHKFDYYIWVSRDQTQPGSFSRVRKEPGKEVGQIESVVRQTRTPQNKAPFLQFPVHTTVFPQLVNLRTARRFTTILKMRDVIHLIAHFHLWHFSASHFSFHSAFLYFFHFIVCVFKKEIDKLCSGEDKNERKPCYKRQLNNVIFSYFENSCNNKISC